MTATVPAVRRRRSKSDIGVQGSGRQALPCRAVPTDADAAAAAVELARRSPALRRIVARVGDPTMGWTGRPRRTHFAELARSICYQQLAGAAARTIHGRFEAIYGGNPTPHAVLATPDAELRAAGLSGSKAAAIRDLASQVEAGTVSLARIGARPNDDVVAELTRVRGIGRWTAEMFLMFQLRRLDVWPVDDLGVRKGFAVLHRMEVAPMARELEVLGDPFRPYRSVAAWYCWRAVDPSLGV
jgi:3-methyladenine DNA glycosylase/8-oxoguanine DNA glycosylase